ncbi:molybdopterin-dependent oxidoreductase [Leptobacterium flavescens]|uniref:Molybdopterin-dependent oxidoreductase n=1 Tax=Leptobacterium flavescens TaxID=472055 RepID=A0A6P0UF38_9FLAO|nr:molybdopterin cofactor-binding domain-containing protein [Leptobacterium flavescens]NER11855.1 molybdopterin-dependent oxidoreductase [Leptobacterium flavescens]
MSKEETPEKKKKGFSRRKFLKNTGIVIGGGSLLLYFGRHKLRTFAAGFIADMDLPSGVSNFDPDFWFEIMEDNTILFKSPKVEMGQGIFTGFAMLAAEELEVAIEQIKVVPGSSVNSANDMAGTGGSGSTHSLYVSIREVAATMREMLRMAAADYWKVPLEDIRAENGMLLKGSESMSYADIVKNTEQWKTPKTPDLKLASSFKYVGTERKRIDLKPKVMGDAIFAIDTEIPDMLYAVVQYPEYIGGKLKSVDSSEAESTNGVIRVIREDNWVAVVAKNRYAAEMGKKALKLEWDVEKTWQQQDIDELVKVGNGRTVKLQDKGSASSVIKDDDIEVIHQEYRTSLGVHAQLEPNGVIADVKEDKAVIIMGTQAISFVKRAVSKAINMSSGKIEIRNSFLGGGFGRRYFKFNAPEAARISQILGKPVQVFRDRESEFTDGYFRPSSHHELKAVLNDDGTVKAISHTQATGDMGIKLAAGKMGMNIMGADFISAGHGAKFLYDFPNKKAYVEHIDMPIPTGIWRGVGMFPNGFAVETFIDELARKANTDPIEFRLKHLYSDDPIVKRMKNIIEILRDRSGWNTPAPEGVGRGFACGEDRKTVAAAAVEVQKIDGQIRVTKVTHIVDPGLVINPDGVRQQVEGCIMMGISASMYEGTYVKDGQMTATNYHQYPMASLMDTPEIEVIMVEGSAKPSGVGEPPIAPMAPAIGNAIFDLTGERQRKLPFQLT